MTGPPGRAANRHRAEPPRRTAPANRHRATRPRYGRLVLAGLSLAVTAVALLGGVGVLPSGATGSPSPASSGPHQVTDQAAYTPRRASAGPTISPTPSAPASPSASAAAPTPAAVPADSGEGRRIVFSQGQQRVWLVDADGHVQRTYPVSGSLVDNLQPGHYAVYSRSRWAVGVSDSGVMQYFVRFTQGPTGAAIGFHSIPTKDGTPLQSRAQLGTPQSHGCIRQDLPDAIALWDFAPLGTAVDVVAA